MFSTRRVAKKLASVGSRVDCSYLVYINNDEPVTFSTHDECMSYIREYRSNNVIFKLQIFRCEVYSL